MILKNISNSQQLVNTNEGKELVNIGDEFETNKGEQLLRMYPDLFQEVKQTQNRKKNQSIVIESDDNIQAACKIDSFTDE